ncbi:MAG: WbqC family protein [Bacteroidales bacterium]|nr:WbqC family protein [Bacteroidales bacterium]
MEKHPQVLLSSTYFGPIQYFARIASFRTVYIEKYEHYLKQSYRNRCEIMAANGKLSLVVPVKKPNGNKTLIKDILIDYDTDWQKIHLQSILSAYKNSAFFEHYFEDYFRLIKKKSKFLFDLNAEITGTVMRHLDLSGEILFTGKYAEEEDNFLDYRSLIHPKKDIEPDTNFDPPDYIQVFSDKHGFMPNLSILDLIFNAGPEAGYLLKRSLNID